MTPRLPRDNLDLKTRRAMHAADRWTAEIDITEFPVLIGGGARTTAIDRHQCISEARLRGFKEELCA